MIATNIEWDIDIDEVIEKVSNTEIGKLKQYVPLVSEVNTVETCLDYFRHAPGALYDFLCLPESEDIDYGIAEEDVADYLSNYYGYCIKSLKIVDTIEKEVNLFAFECGNTIIDVPENATNEEIEESALEAENSGNAYFFDRTVATQETVVQTLASKILELEDFHMIKNPKVAEIIKLSLEYLSLDGLSDAKRASDIAFLLESNAL